MRLKLDAGSAPRPKKISYRASLDGRMLLRRKNETVVLVPPQQVIGSLQGIVVMPSQVAPGEPMQMRVTDSAALPPGGSWSLTGVVVDDLESDGADGEPTSRVALAVPAGEEVPREALDGIAAILGASADGQGRWEVAVLDSGSSPGSAGVTIEEDEVFLDAGAGLGSATYRVKRAGSGNDESASRVITMKGGGRGGETGRDQKIVIFEEEKEDKEESKEGSEDDFPTSYCFEKLPTLPGGGFELKELKDTELCWPFEEKSDDKPKNRIRVRGVGEQGRDGILTYDLHVTVVTQTVQAFTGTDGVVLFDLPESLTPGGELSLQYIDLYGDVVVEVPAVPGVEVVEPLANGAARISAATPRTFAGQKACVCGVFPGPEAWNALLLDGAALGPPVSASSRMAWVELPADLAPGPHVVSGAPEPGFPAEDRVTVLVLQIGGEIDSSKLQRLETTPMRLWVVGTAEPVEIQVRNKTPGIISIDGGPDQTILTSGGEPNVLERTVQGLSPGAFDIAYELTDAGCPCASAGSQYW
ncbi:MAG: hypothetical protein AAF604_23420 [Acidobacteriota bacterium]